MSFKIIKEVARPSRESTSKYPWGSIEEGAGIFVPDESPDNKRRASSLKTTAERYCLRNDLNYEWEAFRIELDGEWGVVCQRPSHYLGEKGRLL